MSTKDDIQFELNIALEFSDYDRAERMQSVKDAFAALERELAEVKAERDEARLHYHTLTDKLQEIGEKYDCPPGLRRTVWIEQRLSEDAASRDALASEVERLRAALEPFGRNADALSLAKVYAHLTREHALTARALARKGASNG